MLIYFDESYDTPNFRYLLLGALFNPHPRFLHRCLTEIKRKNNFIINGGVLGEIKYNYCKTQRDYEVCRRAIDAFFESTSWFRCIVIKQEDFDLNRFGKPYEQDKIKRARAYKKFAELLICHNTENIHGGVLLTDQLTRCSKDLFIEKMNDLFCASGKEYSENKKIPTLTRVEEIPSHLEQYQVLQLCDLLMGCILNNIFPTKNKFKNLIREYLITKLGVKNLLVESWEKYSKNLVETVYPKFNIWYIKLNPNNKKGSGGLSVQTIVRKPNIST